MMNITTSIGVLITVIAIGIDGPAGYMISGFGIGVVITAVAMTAATAMRS